MIHVLFFLESPPPSSPFQNFCPTNTSDHVTHLSAQLILLKPQAYSWLKCTLPYSKSSRNDTIKTSHYTWLAFNILVQSRKNSNSLCKMPSHIVIIYIDPVPKIPSQKWTIFWNYISWMNHFRRKHVMNMTQNLYISSRLNVEEQFLWLLCAWLPSDIISKVGELLYYALRPASHPTHFFFLEKWITSKTNSWNHMVTIIL